MPIVEWTETRRIDLAALTPQQIEAVRRAAAANQGEKMKTIAHLDRALHGASSTGDGGLVVDRSIRIVE